VVWKERFAFLVVANLSYEERKIDEIYLCVIAQPGLLTIHLSHSTANAVFRGPKKDPYKVVASCNLHVEE
jgi:hypothetical protein